jgi:beta-lactamase class A
MADMVIRAVFAMLIGAQTATGQDPAAVPRERVLARVHEVPGATVGVVFTEVGEGAAIFLNADSVFHAASTMKVPVMIEPDLGAGPCDAAGSDRIGQGGIG